MMESVCSFGLVVRRVGSFSYTPRAGNCLVFRRVGRLSDTPLAVISLVFQRVGSFPYTPRAAIYLVVILIRSQFNRAVINPFKTSLATVLDYDSAECFFPVNVAITTATDILVTGVLHDTSPSPTRNLLCAGVSCR